MSKAAVPALMVSLLALSGCTDHGAEPIAPPPDDPAAVVSYAHDIQPIWDAECTLCHAAFGSGTLDLTAGASYAMLVGTAAWGYAGTRVVPGDPHVSVLFLKLVGDPSTGSLMPFGAAPLPTAQLLLVHDWIEQGAADN